MGSMFKLKKDISQLELDVEAFKIQKDLREQKIASLESELASKTTNANLLQDQVKAGFGQLLLILSVVYQKPKLSAKKESFQLSAFGFGRRN